MTIQAYKHPLPIDSCGSTTSTAYSRRRVALAGALLTCVCAKAVAQSGPELDQALSLGVYYAEGSFGETVDTEILYIPLSYELNLDNWGFQLMLPHLEVTGLGNVLVNVGGVTQAVAGTEITRQRGPGDAVASLIYRLDPFSARAPFIDFRLDVKLPTADEDRSLGTGEVDYSAQIDLTQAFGPVVGFASFGYTLRGESALFGGLEDGAFAQIGVQYPLRSGLNTGAYYDFREPASVFSQEIHEVLPYINWQIDDRWSVTGLTGFGFTDASADHSLLLQLRYSF